MKYHYLTKKLDALLNSGDELISIEQTISNIFLEESNKSTENSYELKLIGDIMSLRLNKNSKSEPYKSSHLISVKDISEQDALLLYYNIEQYTDNIIILTRVFDVLWVTKRLGKNNPVAGEKAAKYWYDYISLLLSKGLYIKACCVVERYIMLALSLPNNSEQRKMMFENYKNWIVMKITEENSPFLRELYGLYLNPIKFDGEEHFEIANTILSSSEHYFNNIGEEEIFLKPFVQIIAKISENIGTYEKKKNIWARFAEYYINRKCEEENLFKQIYFLQKAQSCLRRIDGVDYKNKIDDIQKEIELLQTKIPENMYIIKSNSIDISADVNESIKKISGKNIFDSLIVLASNMKWISKEYIDNHTFEVPMDKIAKTVEYNHRGQPKNTSKYKSAENMCISTYYDIQFVRCIVLPMLDTFRAEHFFITQEFLLDLTGNHPWIPDGYEKIYAKGLYYYLIGEYLEAACILIPAFENSLRHMVSIKHPTTYFKKDDVEFDKISIDEMITTLEQDGVITSVVSMNLKYFFGSNEINLRNNLMHGLFSFDEINTTRVIAGLSLIYWMIMYHYVYTQNTP